MTEDERGLVLDNKICFLTYLNRSGSTYLSGILDRFTDLAVGLEEDFPDGLTRGRCYIENEVELDHYLKQLIKSNKFKYWEITVADIKNNLLKKSYPITFRDVLMSLLSLYFGKNSAKFWIHKHGEYILFLEPLFKIFTESKFIFISRDPRAIFLSQKNSKDSIKHKPMTESPVHFAHKYIKYMKQVYKYRHTPKLHVLKYEDLILDEKKAISGLLSFLGIVSKKKSLESHYMDKIPESQMHLHNYIFNGKAHSSDLISQHIDSLSKIDRRSGISSKISGYAKLALKKAKQQMKPNPKDNAINYSQQKFPYLMAEEVLDRITRIKKLHSDTTYFDVTSIKFTRNSYWLQCN